MGWGIPKAQVWPAPESPRKICRVVGAAKWGWPHLNMFGAGQSLIACSLAIALISSAIVTGRFLGIVDTVLVLQC